MKVNVCVFENIEAFERGAHPIIDYMMNHDSAEERRVLGQQCRHAFEHGQVVLTYPEADET